jgi:FPC/CPF motif-containing protein YcgG
MFIDYLREVSHSYVGNGAQRFLQYCEEMMSVNIQDVLNRYDEVSEKLDKYNRDKNSELVQSLKEYRVVDLSEKQLANLTKFLKRLGDDELTAYLLWILDDPSDMIANPKVKNFLSTFKDVLLNIKRINKPSETKQEVQIGKKK